MSEDRIDPKVFSIPAGVPFLPALADAFLSGRLAPIADFSADPLALSDATILLPTRRAVRAFREILIERLGGRAVILPRIRTIADVDEEDHLLSEISDRPEDRLVLPPAISALSRHLILARLIREWGVSVRRELLQIGPDEPTLIPASTTDALRLADDLARLMDDLETAGIGFEAIDGLVPDDQTGYFRITLDFLKIAAENWPKILNHINRVYPAARRDFLIRAEARRLAENPSGPVIAAGSTGSIPATAALLATIARLPSGAVVLPALDQVLDEAGFAAIGDGKDAEAAFGHPQYGLKRLLKQLGVPRGDVVSLETPDPALDLRGKILSEAMRPATTTERWVGFRETMGDGATLAPALDGIGLIVARNEQEEALAIALAMREAIEVPNRQVALVTPDRTLARRVAAELGRWGLVADDSAGKALSDLPPGIFARLLVEAALDPCEPVPLLALLKHPLAAFGLSRPACRRAARILDIGLLRGDRVTGGMDGLREALARARQEATDPKSRHVPSARRRLTKTDWAEAAGLVAAVETILGPLAKLLGSDGEIGLSAFASALAPALSAAARDETGSDEVLWRGRAGEALARLLTDLADESEGLGLSFAPPEAASVLGTLLARVSVTPQPGPDPRLHIWGTLEARLQSVDLLILGGLDESVWPAGTRTDPWLSRPMRTAVGLDPPERRIGQSAHDFAQGFMAGRVLVSRAEKRGGTPTVASRWLQRIIALLGDDLVKPMRERGESYLAIARRLDRVAENEVTPEKRPMPRPPVAARPRSLSITEIETLIRDPYAIYARHVLKLEPLDALGVAPDYAMRGTLIHDALGSFTEGWQGPHDTAALARLLAIGEAALEALADFPDVRAVWSHRFRAIAAWFVDWERERDPLIATRHAEIGGGSDLVMPAGPFRLRGRADRIDIRADGTLDILDFKTGTPPTKKQLLTGFAPQLALEAGMAQEGAFGPDFAGRSIATLAWLALGQVERGEPFRSAVEDGWTADDLGREAMLRLRALITAFDDESRAYQSRARPMFETRFESPYDHLARVREWSLVEGAEE